MTGCGQAADLTEQAILLNSPYRGTAPRRAVQLLTCRTALWRNRRVRPGEALAV